MPLRKYQEEASDFLFSHDYAMLLAPMGAGKTAAGIDAMEGTLDEGIVTRWLVIGTHRICTEVWPVELPKWGPRLTFAVAVGTPAERAAAVEADTDILIINYENLPWLIDKYPDLGNCDGCLYDELTKVKNQGGKRAKAIASRIEQVKVRWGFTGSFSSEGLEDVHGQCKAIHPRILGRSKEAFRQRFFIPINRKLGQWMPRPDAFGKVMDLVKPYAYMLDPGEYTDTLPPIHYVPVKIAFQSPAYRDMLRSLAVQVPDGPLIAAPNEGVALQKLQQLTGGFIYESWREPHPETPGKFIDRHRPHILGPNLKIERLKEIFDENQRTPTLVAYQFETELQHLKEAFPFAWTIDQPGAVEAWNAGRVPMLLLHPKSAAHGLNLQDGGHVVVWLTLPWSLELYEQLNARVHRSGQKHPVWVYILCAEGTIDERILGALADKKTIKEFIMEEVSR